jgi:hypothetical protein
LNRCAEERKLERELMHELRLLRAEVQEIKAKMDIYRLLANNS